MTRVRFLYSRWNHVTWNQPLSLLNSRFIWKTYQYHKLTVTLINIAPWDPTLTCLSVGDTHRQYPAELLARVRERSIHPLPAVTCHLLRSACRLRLGFLAGPPLRKSHPVYTMVLHFHAMNRYLGVFVPAWSWAASDHCGLFLVYPLHSACLPLGPHHYENSVPWAHVTCLGSRSWYFCAYHPSNPILPLLPGWKGHLLVQSLPLACPVSPTCLSSLPCQDSSILTRRAESHLKAPVDTQPGAPEATCGHVWASH